MHAAAAVPGVRARAGRPAGRTCAACGADLSLRRPRRPGSLPLRADAAPDACRDDGLGARTRRARAARRAPGARHRAAPRPGRRAAAGPRGAPDRPTGRGAVAPPVGPLARPRPARLDRRRGGRPGRGVPARRRRSGWRWRAAAGWAAPGPPWRCSPSWAACRSTTRSGWVRARYHPRAVETPWQRWWLRRAAHRLAAGPRTRTSTPVRTAGRLRGMEVALQPSLFDALGSLDDAPSARAPVAGADTASSAASRARRRSGRWAAPSSGSPCPPGPGWTSGRAG